METIEPEIPKEVLELKAIMDNEIRKYLKENDFSAMDLLVIIMQGYMCLIREVGWDECFNIAEKVLDTHRTGSFAIASSMSICGDIYNKVNESLETNPRYQELATDAFNKFGDKE